MSQQENLVKAVKLGRGSRESLVASLDEVKEELVGLHSERDWTVENLDCGEFRSLEEVEAQFETVLRENINASLELAELLRRFFVRVIISPLADLASDQVRPRALIEVDLGLLDGANGGEKRFSTTFDVFEPPVYIRLFDQVSELRSTDPSLSYEAIGRLLKVSGMSIKRTVAYARRMREAGWTEPFQELREPPTKGSRWGRRKPKE